MTYNDLSNDEKMIIELYRECNSVDFNKHGCQNLKEAFKFAKLTGERVKEITRHQGFTWCETKKDIGDKRISVTGFMRRT